MERPARFVILEIQFDGDAPLVWSVGHCLGGTMQTYTKFEVDRELKSFQEARPDSIFKAVPVNA